MATPPAMFDTQGSRMDAMSARLARNWWALALRGGLAILFGLAALILPVATLASLTVLLGVYLLVDGVLALVAGLRAAAHHERWGLLALEGVLNLLAGVVAFLMPGLTLLLLVVLLGVWSVITGAVLLLAAFRLHVAHGRWLLALSGVVSILWGVLLYLSPVAGVVVMAWWLGGYALIFGVMLLVLALRLRGRHVATA